MSTYLETAAALLARATKDLNESEGYGHSRAESAAMRLAIAREYGRLAAIEKGIPPVLLYGGEQTSA